MTNTITQTITALPPAPDPATDTPTAFSLKAVASVLAQKALPGELNAFADQANAVAEEITTNAAAVAAAKIAAENAVVIAQAAASLAQTATGATSWVSGQSYSLNQGVISPGNQRVYRKRTATSSGTTDPKDDPTNWLDVQADAVLQLAGGTMLGALILAADPTSNLHAATKRYVDTVAIDVEELHAALLSF